MIPSPGRIRGRLRHLLDARPVRRAQHELAGALVVEVDEARVGVERVGDLRGDEREHLLEVERRVDRLDRVGEEPDVAVACVHPPRSVRSRPMSLYQWLLALHVTGAFLALGGSVIAGDAERARAAARAAERGRALPRA